MQLDRSPERATPLPSPDMTPPAAPRPSLQLPPLETKDGVARPRCGAAAAVAGQPRGGGRQGKLRPRDIRTSPAARRPRGRRRGRATLAQRRRAAHGPRRAAAWRSGRAGRGAVWGELRRSASERVPRDPACFRFVDPSFFERPSPPVTPQQQRPSSPAVEAALRRRRIPRARAVGFRGVAASTRTTCSRSPRSRRRLGRGGARRDRALRRDRAAPPQARIAEPARDLETLKQILEALQLKGLLRHTRRRRSRRYAPSRRRLLSSSCGPRRGRHSRRRRGRHRPVESASTPTMPGARAHRTAPRRPHGPLPRSTRPSIPAATRLAGAVAEVPAAAQEAEHRRPLPHCPPRRSRQRGAVSRRRRVHHLLRRHQQRLTQRLLPLGLRGEPSSTSSNGGHHFGISLV